MQWVIPGFSYLLGSIPFGLLFARLVTGKDIRAIGSGRTGTTNTLRAAGYPIIISFSFTADGYAGLKMNEGNR